VHVLCAAAEAPAVSARLAELPGVRQVLTAGVGGAARRVA